eukprot:6464785-Prymnesium_polylepis.2
MSWARFARMSNTWSPPPVITSISREIVLNEPHGTCELNARSGRSHMAHLSARAGFKSVQVRARGVREVTNEKALGARPAAHNDGSVVSPAQPITLHTARG